LYNRCEPETSEVGTTSEVLFLRATQAGERLDRWLAARLPQYSRSAIQRWIKAGLVTVKGREEKASYQVGVGDEICVRIPPPEEYAVTPEPLPLNVLYEDADLLVIDKPAGMVVHPAAGNWHGTLVNAVLHHCPELEGVGGERRPGIVHRLDKDTSGLILVAKNDRAHQALQAQFKSRQVEKSYLALVYGLVTPARGRIEAPIGRDPVHRKRMAVLPDGRPAVTRYQVSGFYGNYTLLSCQPLTGRTHQIRVHLAYIKHPVVGDRVYGGRRQCVVPCPRQFLHAHRIQFRLPSTGQLVEFVAPLPTDLQAVLDALSSSGRGASDNQGAATVLR
jgi:23S rRNA pseudouridine1911/1915/1917 synthase